MFLIHRLLLLYHHLLLLLSHILLLKLLIIGLGGISIYSGGPWCNKTWLSSEVVSLRLNWLDRVDYLGFWCLLSLLILLLIISIIIHLTSILVTITSISVGLLIVVPTIARVRIIVGLRIPIVLSTIAHWHLIGNHVLRHRNLLHHAVHRLLLQWVLWEGIYNWSILDLINLVL